MSVVQKFVLKSSLASLIQVRNIFYAQVELVSPDTYDSVWVQYITGIWNHISSYISTLWTMTDYDLYSWVAGEWGFVQNAPLAYNGTSGGEVLPSQIAAVLLGKTLAGRHMGRKFIAGITESYSTGNVPTTALVTDLGLALVDYVSIMTTSAGSVLSPGIMSTGGTFRSFNTGVVSAVWGTMRRRKQGVGI